MTSRFHESELEAMALQWFEEQGYQIAHGPVIAPEEPDAERDSLSEPFLPSRLKSAIARLNPDFQPDAHEEIYRKVTRPESASLNQNNHTFHLWLTDGIPVQNRQKDGQIRDLQAKLIDFDNPENNDYLVVNQFVMEEDRHRRIPDVVVFVNGLPLVVIELKNPGDENATIWAARNQIETYKDQIPSLFTYNSLIVISDGLKSRYGSLTSGKEWFLTWKTDENGKLIESDFERLDVLIKGVLQKDRFLKLIRYYTVFEQDESACIKKVAGYHQFHAAELALQAAVKASNPSGDRRCGVVWHTQGSGKSLTMAFFTGRIILEPAMENPSIVVITDRNDLDEQLFSTFSRCNELLRQPPRKAKNRDDLKKLLKVASGGVVFTTIQKFFPENKGDTYPLLSDRRNIVVIADEAHRSQYDFIDGYARHMRDALPNASFIGFTGTPIELDDKNTQAVFGDYISIYDIQQAVEDGATKPIYYESRLAKLTLNKSSVPHLDEEFEEITEDEEEGKREKLKTKWAALEAIVGSESRLESVAKDLVPHYEERSDALFGKGMVVCMSRRICVDLYDKIVKLRPQWQDKDDKRGAIKIVMTGAASDNPDWQQHIRNKQARAELAKRFKDPEDPLKLVIVRDMWLTGFDVPCLHTMYVDKPMRGHGLMQAIARVNRVFKDKPGGLIVDYLGLGTQLKKALATYTNSGGKGKTAVDQRQAVSVMMREYEVCCDLFHGYDWSDWMSGDISKRYTLLQTGQEHIFAQEDGKKRLQKAVGDLTKAFALSVPLPETKEIRDDVGFFQNIRSALAKYNRDEDHEEDMDHAIQQLISRAVMTDKVVDIFSAAGLKKPDISILSDEFLSEVRDMPHKNLAVELLQRLLNDELKIRRKKFLVQSRSFGDMLTQTIRKYQNRAIETAQVIEELIAMAKEIREQDKRGEDLGLSEKELAFYDALETSDSAVMEMGDETLKAIARDLVETVRKNTTLDWSVRESRRANMRRMVKRILRKYKYPPDKQEKAVETVLQQAEMMSAGMVN